MNKTHHDRVWEQFRLGAPTLAGTGFAVPGLEWIVDQLSPRTDQIGDAAHVTALRPHIHTSDGAIGVHTSVDHGDRSTVIVTVEAAPVGSKRCAESPGRYDSTG